MPPSHTGRQRQALQDISLDLGSNMFEAETCKLKAISLFTGVGGLELGIRQWRRHVLLNVYVNVCFGCERTNRVLLVFVCSVALNLSLLHVSQVCQTSGLSPGNNNKRFTPLGTTSPDRPLWTMSVGRQSAPSE